MSRTLWGQPPTAAVLHRNGYKIIEISNMCKTNDEYRIAALRGRNPENPSDRTKGSPTAQRLEIGGRIANTITSVQKDNLVIKKILSYSRDSKGNVVHRHTKDIAGTVHTKEGSCGNTAQYVLHSDAGRCFGIYDNTKGDFMRPPLADIARTLKADCHNGVIDGLAIRKLTPKECFRLMDVSDDDIEKIQTAGISKSQQYKMAGNSIVVSVLYHIFRKMFVETDNDKGELELF